MATAGVFDRMAPGWYGFRHRSIFQRELEMLARCWPPGRLLNLGCAHGPDFPPFAGGFELHGMDFSREMLRLALKYADKFHFQVSLVLGDIACLPYADASFDGAIAVAAYHHLTPQRQAAAFAELRRVLRPGGEAFVTVWNRWQPRFWLAGKQTCVPWRTGGETLYRYYYLFSPPELIRLVKRAGFRVARSFPEGAPARLFARNVCLLLVRE
jgi:SAM-dependent methyltransferase